MVLVCDSSLALDMKAFHLSTPFNSLHLDFFPFDISVSMKPLNFDEVKIFIFSFVLFLFGGGGTRFCYVAQVDLELLYLHSKN